MRGPRYWHSQVGLNGAAAAVDQPDQRLRVANAGWARWTPVNLAGIAAHLAGGGVLLAATGYSGVLGAKLQRQQNVLQWAIPD